MVGHLVQIRNEPIALAQLAVGPTLYGNPTKEIINMAHAIRFGTPKSMRRGRSEVIERNFYFSYNRSLTASATPDRRGRYHHRRIGERTGAVFSDWTSETTQLAIRWRNSQLPPPQATQIILIDKPGAAQSVISVAELTAERKSPDYYPLNVMNAIFGGQFMSRLNLNLRETKGYTYGRVRCSIGTCTRPARSWPAPA